MPSSTEFVFKENYNISQMSTALFFSTGIFCKKTACEVTALSCPEGGTESEKIKRGLKKRKKKKPLKHSFGIVFIAASFHGVLLAAETRVTVALLSLLFFFFFLFFVPLPEPKHQRETILAMRAF